MKILVYDAYAKSAEPPTGGSCISLIDFLQRRERNSGNKYYFMTNQLNREYYNKYISHLGVKEIYIKFPKSLLKYGKVYEKLNLKKFFLMLFTMGLFSMKVAILLKKKKIDKVIANESRATLTVGLGSWIANRDLITFLRGDYGLNSRLTSVGLYVSSKLICVSEGIYNMLDQSLKEKAKVINESIEIKNTSGGKGSENRITVINIANISQYKNQLVLIKAINEIKKDFPNIKLYIIGKEHDKECLNRIIEYIDRNQLHDYVELTGFQVNVEKYLEKCDIYVQPSINEGLGRTILEAYSFQIPVIGSSIPGIMSVVKDEFNGLLFNPDDHIELASKIKELINNKDKRAFLGENGRRLIEEEFNLEKNVRRIEKFLES